MHTMRSQNLRGAVVSLLALVLAIGCAAPAAAQNGVGALEGTVVDSAGEPVAGARLSLVNSQQASFGATETDARGAFRFASVAPGNYVLVVVKPGFAEKRAAVSTGDSVRVVLPVAPITE